MLPNQSSSCPLSRTNCIQADPQTEQPETDAVEFTGFGVFYIRRIFKKTTLQKQGQQADRHVDVEGPAPGNGVGKIARQMQGQ